MLVNARPFSTCPLTQRSQSFEVRLHLIARCIISRFSLFSRFRVSPSPPFRTPLPSFRIALSPSQIPISSYRTHPRHFERSEKSAFSLSVVRGPRFDSINPNDVLFPVFRFSRAFAFSSLRHFERSEKSAFSLSVVRRAKFDSTQLLLCIISRFSLFSRFRVSLLPQFNAKNCLQKGLSQWYNALSIIIDIKPSMIAGATNAPLLLSPFRL